MTLVVALRFSLDVVAIPYCRSMLVIDSCCTLLLLLFVVVPCVRCLVLVFFGGVVRYCWLSLMRVLVS